MQAFLCHSFCSEYVNLTDTVALQNRIDNDFPITPIEGLHHLKERDVILTQRSLEEVLVY